jgi:hypothetical protein
VDLFRESMRRHGDRFLGFLDEIGAPLMTLRTIGNPFFRFSFAGGAKEGEVGSSAQLECLLKFLGCTTEVFFMEIDFCEKPVKGRAILHPKTDLIDLLEGFVQHFQSQAKLGVEEGEHPIFRVVPKGPLIDT